jgi:hypothetical protein
VGRRRRRCVGATQGRSASEARRMATDLVEVMTDGPGNVVVEYVLPG